MPIITAIIYIIPITTIIYSLTVYCIMYHTIYCIIYPTVYCITNLTIIYIIIYIYIYIIRRHRIQKYIAADMPMPRNTVCDALQGAISGSCFDSPIDASKQEQEYLGNLTRQILSDQSKMGLTIIDVIPPCFREMPSILHTNLYHNIGNRMHY